MTDPSGIDPMIYSVMMVDSENFCSTVFNPYVGGPFIIKNSGQIMGSMAYST